METPIYVGDSVRFTELAWEVWDRGWGLERQHSMSTDYAAFGAEVMRLYKNLKRLQHTIERAQSAIRLEGVKDIKLPGCDGTSLKEIIGGYGTTLEQIIELLKSNTRFSTIAGPMNHTEWSTTIVPQARHLRAALIKHNLRIGHLIEPLQRDLFTVSGRRWTGNSGDNKGSETSGASVSTPDFLLPHFQASFERHHVSKENLPLWLREITDCFLFHLEKTNTGLEMSPDDAQTLPSVNRSLDLLKCQFLLDKIDDSNVLESLPRISHWHGYIHGLGERLSEQSSSIDKEIEQLDLSMCPYEMLVIWPEREPATILPLNVLDSAYRCLLELPVATLSDKMGWRMIQLSRHSTFKSRLRIIDTSGYKHPPPTFSTVVDFNIDTTKLIPLYAMPVLQHEEPAPLELILETSHASHRYVFLQQRDLFRFQGAITGFNVEYMQSSALVVFVRPDQRESLEEQATVQLWIPSYCKEQDDGSLEGGRRPDSVTSRDSTSQGRPESVYSTHSTTSSVFSSHSASTMSYRSLDSSVCGDDTPVAHDLKTPSTGLRASLIRRAPSRLRRRTYPTEPLLVLFTNNSESMERSVVFITVNEDTEPDAEKCRCLFDEEECCISPIVQRRSRTSTLRGLSSLIRSHPSALKVKRATLRDFLSLKEAPDWPGLTRVSIKFQTPEERRKFGGKPCSCTLKTGHDVNECLKSGHLGMLGAAREFYRRQRIMMEGRKPGQHLSDISEQSSVLPLLVEQQKTAVRVAKATADYEFLLKDVTDQPWHQILTQDRQRPSVQQAASHVDEDLELVDEELRSDFEVKEDRSGLLSYTCTPPPSVSTDRVPLNVSGWPVVIPVEATYPPRALFVPLPDPHPRIIDPRHSLTNELIEEIFDLFDEALGLYLLIGGRLQLIVPDDFDYSYALSHMPRQFGGLEVSYIPQNLTPCAGVTSASDARQQLEGARSDTNTARDPPQLTRPGTSITPSSSASTSLASGANTLFRMTIGSAIQAVVTGSKSKNRFEGRVGVMTRCRDRKYITIPTHVATSALLSSKCPAFPGGSWTQLVTLVASNGGLQLGPIAQTFDPDAGQFPSGFSHDVSLVDVSHVPANIVSGIRAPIPTAWASPSDWHEAKYSTTKLCLLSNVDPSPQNVPAKSIGLLDSQCQAIGEGIFRLQQPRKSLFSALRKEKENKGAADAWTSLVARSLLFRVHPGCRPPGAQSGSAVCILQEDDEGTKLVKVAGFTAFAQETTAIQSFDTEGPRLYSRLEQGRVAFYGAFQVPSKLRDEHVIV